MNGNSIVELVNSLESKPGVYLTNYSIFSLKAYIDGWCYAKGLNDENYSIMYDFQVFIIKKYNQEETMSWDKIINLYSYSEFHAMEKFFELFEFFIKSQK